MQQNIKIIKYLIKAKPENDEELSKVKRKLAREFGIGIVSNNWLLKEYRKCVVTNLVEFTPWLEDVLIKRRVRTLSGVAPLTVATKPYPCPGRCVYCPFDVRMPKSYLPSQPAAARALRFKFNPYKQTQGRLQAFYDNGHKPEKVDLRILGGTWSAYPKAYQTRFVKELYRGLNDYMDSSDSCRRNDKSLEQLQKKNENAKHRCIGLSIETRPDWVTMEEVKRWRKFGVTKVELGVQHLDKKVLDLIKRDHYKEDVVRATKMLKDAGFKVAYHIMPNLPGSTPKKDLTMFAKIFSDSAMRPDQLKIYPCVVLKNAPLYKWFKQGKYKTYSNKILIKLLAQMKAYVPEYIRIERINRDVPSTDIVNGSKTTNIRELVQSYMAQNKIKCKCIRCREVRDQIKNHLPANRLEPQGDWQAGISKIFITKYNASSGTEYFISFELSDKKILYAFTRLRLPSKNTKNQLKPLQNTAIIRELHTYGQLVPIASKNRLATQHKGLGKKLIARAEQIAKIAGYDKIAVISGIGVRGYYRKLGYAQENKFGYMIKKL